MSYDEAYKLLRRLRWPDGEPVCPHCGSCGAWDIAAKQKLKDGTVIPRPLLKCKAKECRLQFSVTSDTIFHSHKTALPDILFAVFEFSRGAKGFAALSQVFQQGIGYKNAFVFEHKLRQAITGINTLPPGQKLRGHVEGDIIFLGGHKRPERHRLHRVDRRLKEYQTGKRQGVLVLRERGPDGRVITFNARNESFAIPHIQRNVLKGSDLYLDSAGSWDILEAHYNLHLVDHSTTFARWEDHLRINTNQAESYNSRLRRAEVGTHHRVAGNYILAYAGEMAWREANRRKTARQQFEAILSAALQHPQSLGWLTYWGKRPSHLRAEAAA